MKPENETNNAIANYGASGISPDLPFPRKCLNCKSLMDTLMGPHEEMPQAACGQQVDTPVLYS